MSLYSKIFFTLLLLPCLLNNWKLHLRIFKLKNDLFLYCQARIGLRDLELKIFPYYPSCHHYFFDLIIFLNEYFISAIFTAVLDLLFILIFHFHFEVFLLCQPYHNLPILLSFSFLIHLLNKQFLFINFSFQGYH